MNLYRTALFLAKKDLYSELKTKQILTTQIIFAGLVIVVFSFAFDPANNTTKAVIPGVIWVIIVFAGILGLNRSFISEQRNDTIQGLLVAPMEAQSIYLGKFLANFAMMLVVELVSIPFLFLLFDFKFLGSLPYFILTIFLGSFGFIAIGTFLAALAANSKSSEMLLPLLLFPITTPILIGVVQATKIILSNMEKLSSAIAWIQLVTAYDVIFFVVCFLLIDYVLEV
ncbi:heme exporter protein CcmB [Neobacillus sp. MM2021_6]|uniref:heme exporter protein CcmB n=1 Tax=Bacillaceae TaxID=186817 RepID=UPI001407C8D2|nr:MULTISPECIES: heme exporter protein CcmB [Bacillaceae]MBO0960786.1 heme exporter protein CcmB [Neobacillus sp. MM2021_6]NHC17090.1 ABC transporter permease [Bacillus sp. MM2020_4]WML40512.1 heme exporter protein CcmB [Neobacillus sp. OS1-2]